MHSVKILNDYYLVLDTIRASSCGVYLHYWVFIRVVPISITGESSECCTDQGADELGLCGGEQIMLKVVSSSPQESDGIGLSAPGSYLLKNVCEWQLLLLRLLLGWSQLSTILMILRHHFLSTFGGWASDDVNVANLH